MRTLRFPPKSALRATCSTACLLTLAACATAAPPKVVYQPVDKPVPVSCVPAGLKPTPKVHTPAELAALGDGPARYVALAADYMALFARSLEAEAVVAGCRTP